MTPSDAMLRIAEMGVDHYRGSTEFERAQKEAVADVLQQVIDIIGFEPGPPYDEPLFKGAYSVPRLLDHIQAIKWVAEERS